MPNPFFSFSKGKSTTMSNNPATTTADDTSTASAHTTTTTTIEPEYLFREVYQCAKLNSEWYSVSKAIKEHPQWLTRIPEGRKWTMLHQLVFAGNVHNLREALGFQVDNPTFQLLCRASDGKTVRDVATERAHANPHMIRYIEQLIFGDQILKNINDKKWDVVIQAIRQQPNTVNEKPPYRQYYVGHQLAEMGELDIFKRIHAISPFKLDLTVNNKTIAQIAREKKKLEFAAYVESLPTETPTPASTASSTGPPARTSQNHHSPGFHDDISISIFPPNFDFSAMTTHSNHQHHSSHYSAGHGAMGNPYAISHTASAESASGHHGASKEKPSTPKTTPEEDAAYEKSMISNASKLSGTEITTIITCPITKQIMRDPVIAADGFTYERDAIVEWFTNSKRSPMTNNDLNDTDLKPNQVIKSLLKSLEDVSKTTKFKPNNN